MRVTLPTWRTRFLAIVLVLLASAVTLRIWRRSAVPALQHGICRDCNVLLITIDTLRADRVGAFGGPASLTPALDRLASEGLRLTRAYTVAPLTLPAHTSILTAVSPPVHGVRANGLFRLGPKLPTLATVLKDGGYRTGAFVGAFVLDARFGLNRGFDVYDDRYGEKHPGDDTEGAERRAEDVIRPATAWITEQSGSAPPAQPGSVPGSSRVRPGFVQSGVRNAIQPASRNRGPHGADLARWGGSAQAALVCVGPPVRPPRTLSRARTVRIALCALRRRGGVHRRDARQVARGSHGRRAARSHAGAGGRRSR
jgi:hypothetical protein